MGTSVIRADSLEQTPHLPVYVARLAAGYYIHVQVTGQHDRLINWTVAQDGQPLTPASLSKSAAGDLVQSSGKGFRRLRPNENTSLLITVATVGEKQVIDFEFTDIDLP